MKTQNRLIAIALFLSAALLGAPLARAQTVSPNPAPTIIKTAPYVIKQPGYYQLGADLTVSNTSGSIVSITASNVTRDFAGHYISGPNSAASTIIGVSANEEGNLTIQNGTVAFCRQGILLSGNGSNTSLNINQRVQNMLVTYCFAYGIQYTAASNSVIVGNRISFIGSAASAASYDGIYDSEGTGNIADGNIITNVQSTTANAAAAGIAGSLYNGDSSLTVSNNRVSNVTNTANAQGALGIFEGAFILNNTVYSVNQGIYTSGKYSNNLTYNCTTPFGGGTSVIGNN